MLFACDLGLVWCGSGSGLGVGLGWFCVLGLVMPGDCVARLHRRELMGIVVMHTWRCFF